MMMLLRSETERTAARRPRSPRLRIVAQANGRKPAEDVTGLPLRQAERPHLPGDWFRLKLFAALWLFIGLVSSYDAALTVKFQESLPQMERNPMARCLLRLEAGNPGLLIGAKFCGTLFVLGALALLHHFRQRLARWATAGVAGFQLGLLAFLTL